MRLAYQTATINRDFRIKVAGIDPQGNKINTLVGVSGLLNLIGVEFANKFLDRAYSNGVWTSAAANYAVVSV